MNGRASVSPKIIAKELRTFLVVEIERRTHVIATITSNPSDLIGGFQLTFSIFALLMLSFAIPFLSAKFRAKLGRRKVVACLVIMLVLIPAGLSVLMAVLLDVVLNPKQFRFVENNDQKYFADLARASDVMMMQNPLGTNDFVLIGGTNASLPKIIQDLKPSRIIVASNYAHITVGNSRMGFGISWKLDETKTNSWTMSVNGEDGSQVVYSEAR